MEIVNSNITTKYLIGIDEVGRGPLAGPVTLGCFKVEVTNMKKVYSALKGITDSKKLSAKRRTQYYLKIKELQQQGLLDFSISHVAASVIDTKGITYAITTAIHRSLNKVNASPEETEVFLDGGLWCNPSYSQETIIKGDQKNWLIGAASVVAKVRRDALMVRKGRGYPEYGFERHKGYGTKYHKAMIRKYGLLDIHRKTWVN